MDTGSEQNWLSFVRSLEKSIPEERRSSNMRILSKGLFVSETEAAPLIECYQNWHQQQTGSYTLRSEEKCRRHLFGDEGAALQYLVDGKICMAGFLVPFSLEKIDGLGIPPYRASLTDARSYLHPRDPMLKSIESIEARLDPAKGLSMQVNVKGRVYPFSAASLEQFAEQVKFSRRLAAEFPDVSRGLRYALPALVEVLRHARRPRAARGVMIPASFRKSRGIRFLRYQRLFLILGADNQLLKVYELRARNLAVFLRNELNLLRRDKNSRRMGPLSLFTNPGASVASIRIKGKPYRLSALAFRQFISALLAARSVPPSLPREFTLRDTFKLFAEIIRNGTWVPKRDIPQRMYEKLEGHELLLRSDVWVLVVDGDNFVRCMREGR